MGFCGFLAVGGNGLFVEMGLAKGGESNYNHSKPVCARLRMHHQEGLAGAFGSPDFKSPPAMGLSG